jgi:hypothetical protein
MKCSAKEIPTSYVVAGNTVVMLAQVVDEADALIDPDAVDVVYVNLYDMTEGDRVNVDLSGAEIADDEYADTPDVAEVVFAELQQDSRWTEDSQGYNVAYSLATPEPDQTYEVRLTITTTSGSTLVVARRLVSR